MSKDIFSNTRRNIMGISIGIVMGTLLIFSWMTQFAYRESLFDDVDQQLLTHKNMILNDMHVKYDNGKIVEVVLPSPLVRGLVNYVWHGDQLVKGSPHPYKGEHEYPVFPEGKNGKIISIHDGAYAYRGIQFMNDNCRVQILLSVDTQLASLKSLQEALRKAFLVLLLICFVISFYLAKVALKPLYRAYNKQAAFIQDASHEMRTPLAVIKGKIELIVREPNDTIEVHYNELSSIMSELSGLEKLNKDLLLLSKEDMRGILEIQSVQLGSVFKEITEFYSVLSELHDLKFEDEIIRPELEVEWDVTKVRRCMSILLENAIKYSDAQGRISLKVIPEDKGIKVLVEDTGRGMTQDEMAHIFDRFYRSKEVRALGIEGSGIGLSLLQSLAYTMGVKIKVDSEYGKGSSFYLWIPKKMSNKYMV